MQCLDASRGEGFCQIDHLASLFAWVVGFLKKVPSAEANVPKRALLELVQKCLRILAFSNEQLRDSAFLLAKLMDDSSLVEKIKNLSRVILSNTVKTNGKSSSATKTSVNFLKMEEDMRQAARKLELFKQRVTKIKTSSTDHGTDKPQTWTLAKEWNPCPIGKLPRTACASGYLPSLDLVDNGKEIHVLDRKKTQNPSKHGVKRGATLDLALLDNSTAKKKRERKQVSESDQVRERKQVSDQVRERRQVSESDHDDVLVPIKAKGFLLINGIWKSVTEEEFQAIKSSVRILV